MALSTYFNWDTPQTPNSGISTNFNDEPTLPFSEESFFLPNTTFFDPTYLTYPSNMLSCTFSYDPLVSLTDIFPTEDNYNINLLPFPKRQKCHNEEQELQHPSSLYDGFVPNPGSIEVEELLLPEIFSTVPEFKVPELPFCVGNVDFHCEKKTEKILTISPQSVAARERRKRITEKTQELGKLVPGGPKMNTAEMFHAAAKYVKYLQAQVGMLELMKTFEKDEAAPPSEDLHALIVSPFVQEKMYTHEMCFVPKEFVTTLTKHDVFQSRPSILIDLKQLVGTNIEKKTKQE
ncbi:unnamed protein product [Lupinus luteus]|uniref:BHLH domain-containing protein n=1 Tax=Lupinus luteus TaxID=3873 RepID=A0AAV1WN02_LUPLU